MSEWKEYKLGELVQTNKKSIDSDYPFEEIEYLDTGSITRGKIESFQKYKLSEAPSRAKRLVVQDDIIYSTVRPIQRHYGFIDNPLSNLVVSTGFATITCEKDKLNPKFLYYLLSNDDTVEYLDVIAEASTSAYPSLRPSDIENLEIAIPGLPEQKSIASILSSLDDKIDLLHCQNATLEKIAETLFRQWFVERRPEPVEGEAKDEWKEIKLGRIVDIINGVSYNSDDLNPSKTAMVTLKNFDRNGGFRMDGFKEYIGKYKKQHILKEGDLVVAQTDITQEAGVIGNPVMVIGNPKYDTLVFSMDLVKVISKDENYSNEFLYLLMKSRAFKEHCLGYSNGSTVLHLSKKAIPEYEMKLPSKNFINDFSIKIKPLVQKQYRNQTQIRTLTALRDTLLPKLMSGEIRVL